MPPPASAWEKISAARDKKKHNGVWLKIAASLLIISGIAYILWPSKLSTRGNSDMVANHSPANVPVVTSDIDSTLANRATVEKIEQGRKIFTPPPSSKQKKQPLKSNHHAPAVAVADVPVKIEDDLIIITPEFFEEEQAVATNNVEAKAGENQNKSITLSYSSEETSKYLNKKELDEATSESTKPSTLKKLLQKAGDLKNNQDPLGDLRQMKNEILALNFKNEKRGQNK